MKLCPTCQRTSENDQRFCRFDGTLLVAPSVDPSAGRVNQRRSPPDRVVNPRFRSRRSTRFLVGSGIVAAGVVAVFAVRALTVRGTAPSDVIQRAMELQGTGHPEPGNMRMSVGLGNPLAEVRLTPLDAMTNGINSSAGDEQVVIAVNADGVPYLGSGASLSPACPQSAVGCDPLVRVSSWLRDTYRSRSLDHILTIIPDRGLTLGAVQPFIVAAREAGVRVLGVAGQVHLASTEAISTPHLAFTVVDLQLPPHVSPGDSSPGGFPRPDTSNVTLEAAVDGRVTLNCQFRTRYPLPAPDLDRWVHRVFDSRPTKLLFIAAEPGVPLSRLMAIVNTVRGAGVHVVALEDLAEYRDLPANKASDSSDVAGKGCVDGIAMAINLRGAGRAAS